jgi:hypothetical protein
VAAAKKTFSYKINHLFRIINPIRSIPLNRKSESLIILTNLHNNTPLDCSEEVIQLMLSFSGISRVSVLGLYQPWYSWLYELHHKQVYQVHPDIRKAIFINAMFKCAYQDQWLVLSDSKQTEWKVKTQITCKALQISLANFGSFTFFPRVKFRKAE